MARAKHKKVLTGEEIFSLLRGHQDILRKYKVKKIGLFGSYVRKEQKGEVTLTSSLNLTRQLLILI